MKLLKEMKDPQQAREFLSEDFRRFLAGLAGGKDVIGDYAIFDFDWIGDVDLPADKKLVIMTNADKKYFELLERYSISRGIPTDWVKLTTLLNEKENGILEWKKDIVDLFEDEVVDKYRRHP